MPVCMRGTGCHARNFWAANTHPGTEYTRAHGTTHGGLSINPRESKTYHTLCPSMAQPGPSAPAHPLFYPEPLSQDEVNKLKSQKMTLNTLNKTNLYKLTLQDNEQRNRALGCLDDIQQQCQPKVRDLYETANIIKMPADTSITATIFMLDMKEADVMKPDVEDINMYFGVAHNPGAPMYYRIRADEWPFHVAMCQSHDKELVVHEIKDSNHPGVRQNYYVILGNHRRALIRMLTSGNLIQNLPVEDPKLLQQTLIVFGEFIRCLDMCEAARQSAAGR